MNTYNSSVYELFSSLLPKVTKDSTVTDSTSTVSKNSCKAALDNENNIIELFNQCTHYKTQLMNMMGKPLCSNITMLKPSKKNGYTLTHTQKWIDFKHGTGEIYPSPKTDVIVDYDGCLIPISVKSGCGRVTSAAYYEMNAIFRTCLEPYSENHKLVEIVNRIMEAVKSVEPRTMKQNFNDFEKKYNTIAIDNQELREWYENYKQVREIVNNDWNILLSDHYDYVEDIIYECLRGHNKFGDNIGRADYLMITQSKNTKINKLISLLDKNKDFKKYCKSYIEKNKYPFAIKSSNGKWWIRFM